MDRQHDYPVLRDYEGDAGTRTHIQKTARGSRYPSLYLITKHLLLAIIFLMVIWTSLEILFAEQKDRSKYPPDMPDSSLTMMKSIVLMGRVLVVVVCMFGIFGMVKESFSLALVFSVFMFIRLVGTLYIPFFNNGVVSTVLICLVTLMSLIFLSLVRRPDPEFVPTPTPTIRIGIDNPLRI